MAHVSTRGGANVYFEEIVGLVVVRVAKGALSENDMFGGQAVIFFGANNAHFSTVIDNYVGGDVQALIVFRDKDGLVPALLLLPMMMTLVLRLTSANERTR